MERISEEQAKAWSAVLQSVIDEVGTIIVGQKHALSRLLMAFAAEGHVLLEGLPGLAKTSMVKAFSQVCDLSFSRIQFTPDLMPSDVVGTQVYDPKSTDFVVRKGPVFCHLLLADEINRAPAKVQSALLEAMQERQVTIGSETFHLPEPFLVLATQNPIEQEGTYTLPEAQVDRFLFKIEMGYLTHEQEVELLRSHEKRTEKHVKKILSGAQIKELPRIISGVYCDELIFKYIVDIVVATREPEKVGLGKIGATILYGASPRASLSLERASRVLALMKGRNFVLPEDVKEVAVDVLRHRIILADPTAKSVEVVRHILSRVIVPQ